MTTTQKIHSGSPTSLHWGTMKSSLCCESTFHGGEVAPTYMWEHSPTSSFTTFQFRYISADIKKKEIMELKAVGYQNKESFLKYQIRFHITYLKHIKSIWKWVLCLALHYLLRKHFLVMANTFPPPIKTSFWLSKTLSLSWKRCSPAQMTLLLHLHLIFTGSNLICSQLSFSFWDSEPRSSSPYSICLFFSPLIQNFWNTNSLVPHTGTQATASSASHL